MDETEKASTGTVRDEEPMRAICNAEVCSRDRFEDALSRGRDIGEEDCRSTGIGRRRGDGARGDKPAENGDPTAGYLNVFTASKIESRAAAMDVIIPSLDTSSFRRD